MKTIEQEISSFDYNRKLDCLPSSENIRAAKLMIELENLLVFSEILKTPILKIEIENICKKTDYFVNDRDYKGPWRELTRFIPYLPQTEELDHDLGLLFEKSKAFKEYWIESSTEIARDIKEFTGSASEFKQAELVRYINENPINFNSNTLDMNWKNLADFIVAQPESTELDKDIAMLLKKFPSFRNFCSRLYPKFYADAKNKAKVKITPEQEAAYQKKMEENKKFREYMNAKVAANRIQDQIARQAAAVQKH